MNLIIWKAIVSVKMTTAITISKVKQNDKPEKSMYNSYYKDMVIKNS